VFAITNPGQHDNDKARRNDGVSALACLGWAACSSSAKPAAGTTVKSATFALHATLVHWMLPLENGANEEPWT